jgi:hypothetical protein
LRPRLIVPVGPHIYNKAREICPRWSVYTDKEENKIFLIYKEIQNGAVAKSYRTNGLLIYG